MIRSLISKNNTIKNIGYLTLGNVIAQIISLIGALYIPTLLGSEKYGVYNTVTAYVAFFTIFSYTGLNKIIIRETAKDLTKAKEILEATFGFRNMFSLLATLISIFIVLFIDYEIGTKIYIAIFSISLLLTGTQDTFNTIYQSFEKMKTLAVFTMTSQLIRVPLSILFLKMGYGILSLLVIQICIQLIILLINYRNTRNFVFFNVFSKIRLVKKYVIPGLNFTLIDMIGALSSKIDIIMLSFLTTPTNVGIYAFAYNIANKGLIIRAPLSQSLFPYYSRKTSMSNKITNKLLFKQTFVIVIPAVFIAITVSLFSKDLIVSFIGVEYAQSSDILNILIFYLIMNYASIPFGLFLQTTKNESKVIYINVIRAILNISLNIIFYNYFGIIGVAYSTLFTISFATITQIVIGVRINKN